MIISHSLIPVNDQKLLHTTLHHVMHLLNNPLHIRLIEESQRCEVHIELGSSSHLHGVDGVWTDRVVANGKDAIVTTKIKESGKAYVNGISNSIYDWVAFHCRREGGGGGGGGGREDGGGREGERRGEEGGGREGAKGESKKNKSDTLQYCNFIINVVIYWDKKGEVY